MSVESILSRSGPRKLLALDGGGIRGLITIEVLAEIECQLKQALVNNGKLALNDTFVLADYFDYIAGTSTGAIIATCLSLGMSVDEIRQFYEESGEIMFEYGFWQKLIVRRLPIKSWRKKIVQLFPYQYKDDKLKEKLQSVFKEKNNALMKLGSNSLKTLLMIVMRSVKTDSPWPVSNNPFALFNDRKLDDCNLDFPLWQLVRASTAAPTFFPPEEFMVGNKPFIFVDGGITPYNNPAFQLFLMATAPAYKLNWEAGEDKMLLVSVGTGLTPKIQENLKTRDMHILYQAQSIPSALMFAVQNEQDLLCRVFGKCLSGDIIDSEVGDLIGQMGPANPKLFTYVRYDAELSAQGLDRLGVGHVDPIHLQTMDSVEYMEELQEVGRAIASQKINLFEKDFAVFLS